MLDATGLRHLDQVPAQSLDVVRHSVPDRALMTCSLLLCHVALLAPCCRVVVISKCSQHGSAAGDRHPRTGDVTTFIGGQQHVHGRKLSGLARSA